MGGESKTHLVGYSVQACVCWNKGSLEFIDTVFLIESYFWQR
jgi:hypothetical protein